MFRIRITFDDGRLDTDALGWRVLLLVASLLGAAPATTGETAKTPATAGDKGALEKARADVAAMRGIAPNDVIADMVAAQLVAAHEATMRCFKLAVVPDQPYSVVHECLSQANKLVALLDTL